MVYFQRCLGQLRATALKKTKPKRTLLNLFNTDNEVTVKRNLWNYLQTEIYHMAQANCVMFQR